MKPGNPSMDAMREQRAFRVEFIVKQLGVIEARLDTLFKDKGGYSINKDGLIMPTQTEVKMDQSESDIFRESQEQVSSLFKELEVLKSQ